MNLDSKIYIAGHNTIGFGTTIWPRRIGEGNSCEWFRNYEEIGL